VAASDAHPANNPRVAQSNFVTPRELRIGPVALRNVWVASAVALVAAVAFYFSTKDNHHHFDYTTRIASALLHGHLGPRKQPPSWLNEMVPGNGRYYSVFPFGAVLSVVPVALLQKIPSMKDFPGKAVATVLAGLCVYFFFQLSSRNNISLGRRILLALFPIFGTWTWCNLGFGGAWQIALGFAMVGQTAALYYTLVRPRPLIAGMFFALAFGNRAELLITAPLHYYLWTGPPAGVTLRSIDHRKLAQWFREVRPAIVRFSIVPAVLGLLTAAYNFARFHSVFDFGYAHIPNVLQEPWYQHGLFSFTAIPWNMNKMIFEGFTDRPNFPYLMPHAFGCSIFITSPFLFLLFREGGKHRAICWTAIGLLTFVLWCHGNPGGWQFSYRYAMMLIPWMYLLLLENGPRKLSANEVGLFLVSIAINAVGTYEFLWTNNVTP
jgi:hypothetical protein